MQTQKNSLTILILAAGTSSRLGEAKQLLKFKNETLIRRAVKQALDLTPNVYVVLGHKKEDIEKEIQDLKVNILFNKNYQEGMGSTIAYGISNIKKSERVLIMLTDQPLIPKEHFQKLLAFNTTKIVASKYNGKKAVPAIFPESTFEELKKLNGDKGAREILRNNDTTFIELDDKLATDIDLKEDLEQLVSERKSA